MMHHPASVAAPAGLSGSRLAFIRYSTLTPNNSVFWVACAWKGATVAYDM